ncbi:MAG TPA: YnbE family lipoprotein [Holosporales bacterium]|nr:YnbE family lipoprotein [Holosporales bacterium]
MNKLFLFKTKKLLHISPIALSLLLFSCSPVVTVKAPKKPIEVNINLKIDHKLKVKVDRELDKVIKKNPDIF